MCNVCGDTLKPFYPDVRDPLTDELFAIFTCRRCGLGHTAPQPVDMGRYYAATYYGNRHGLTLRYCMRRRLRLVAAAVPEGAGRRLLDIGCGDGSFLLTATRAGWVVVGTELNPQPARRAGLDVREEISRVAGEGLFDCITMWHTLEHMRDIPSMLRHVERLLKPEGKVIIAVPDFGGLQARLFRKKWLHLDVPRHLYHFDADSLFFALASCCFSVEHKWHQEFEYDLLGWSQSALNCIMEHPNVFLDSLAGKLTGRSASTVAASFILGALLSVLALPLVAVGTLAKRGGTLIVVAGKRKDEPGQSTTDTGWK
jgi:SAM-dependent methyltransferase